MVREHLGRRATARSVLASRSFTPAATRPPVGGGGIGDAKAERHGRELAAAAHDGDIPRMMACAVAVAEASGDEVLTAGVAGFDEERVTTVGRVARALTYDARLFARLLRQDGLIDEQFLRDIAGDGLTWREARLEALYGREYEREYLRVHGSHAERKLPDGTLGRLGGGVFPMLSGRGALTVVLHQLRIAAECDLPMEHYGYLNDADAAAEAVRELERLPGRLRVRAARFSTMDPLVCRLGYEVLYEGIAEPEGAPMLAALRLALWESRQTTPEKQRRRLLERPLPGLPALEAGLWSGDDPFGPAEMLLPGSTMGPAPRASLEALLGGSERRCPHPTVTWYGGRLMMVSATCNRCGEEVLRRPRTRVDAMMPGLVADRRRVAEECLPRIQALSCLVGISPPSSAVELLDAPRADDWRMEIARERVQQRQTVVPRGRPRSMREAMMRR